LEGKNNLFFYFQGQLQPLRGMQVLYKMISTILHVLGQRLPDSSFQFSEQPYCREQKAQLYVHCFPSSANFQNNYTFALLKLGK